MKLRSRYVLLPGRREPEVGIIEILVLYVLLLPNILRLLGMLSSGIGIIIHQIQYADE